MPTLRTVHFDELRTSATCVACGKNTKKRAAPLLAMGVSLSDDATDLPFCKVCIAEMKPLRRSPYPLRFVAVLLVAIVPVAAAVLLPLREPVVSGGIFVASLLGMGAWIRSVRRRRARQAPFVIIGEEGRFVTVQLAREPASAAPVAGDPYRVGEAKSDTALAVGHPPRDALPRPMLVMATLLAAFSAFLFWNLVIVDVRVTNRSGIACKLDIDGDVRAATPGVRYAKSGEQRIVLECPSATWSYDVNVNGSRSILIDIDDVIATGEIQIEEVRQSGISGAASKSP